MKFAPIGVGAAMAHTIATNGLRSFAESWQTDWLAVFGAGGF